MQGAVLVNAMDSKLPRLKDPCLTRARGGVRQFGSCPRLAGSAPVTGRPLPGGEGGCPAIALTLALSSWQQVVVHLKGSLPLLGSASGLPLCCTTEVECYASCVTCLLLKIKFWVNKGWGEMPKRHPRDSVNHQKRCCSRISEGPQLD